MLLIESKSMMHTNMLSPPRKGSLKIACGLNTNMKRMYDEVVKLYHMKLEMSSALGKYLTIKSLHYLHQVLVRYWNHHNSTWEAQKDLPQAFQESTIFKETIY